MKKIRAWSVCTALAAVAALALTGPSQEKKETAETHKIVQFAI